MKDTPFALWKATWIQSNMPEKEKNGRLQKVQHICTNT